MKVKTTKTLLFMLLLCFIGYAYGGNTPSEDDAVKDSVSKTDEGIVGNFEAGELRYKKSCVNCHGAAGKGAASYPKISGQEISYTVSKLETYRDGIKIGPNSSLMIMMAKPLSDQEIADLAAYLKDVTL